jgi:hypothetical protein
MINLNPELNAQFDEFRKKTCGCGLLSERESALVNLAAAFLLEDGDIVRQNLVVAKQRGITNEEIGCVNAMMIVMKGQKIANVPGMNGEPSNSGIKKSTCCC